MDFYFQKFEHRRPEPPQPYSATLEVLFQVLAIATIILGVWYLHWRWAESLNPHALWFAIPLVIAESLAFVGTILTFLNFWMIRDFEQKSLPETMADVVEEKYKNFIGNRPINIDIYFPVYNEEPELVRLSVQAAKKVKKLPSWNVKIYLLDDSKNPEMVKMATDEGIERITRDNRKGYKAGALAHALTQTKGDFIVICDADTRVFPDLLIKTMGYFRDPKVAWVQTPQWFYDIPEGVRLNKYLGKKIGKLGEILGSGIEGLVGPIKVGEDPFGNNNKMFFDVIQRRRNAYNASFCCGATSIQRRTVVEQVALKRYAERLKEKEDAAEDLDVEYFVYHVSEDLYTSITLHDEGWTSVLHPEVLSKMLSPQDLLTWTIQRFKYAGGTLDIAKKERLLFKRKGLTLGQRLMYMTTMWSYFGAIWNMTFLCAPIVYLFTGIPPVKAYSLDFLIHLIPFLILNEIALMIATWGVSSTRGSQYYIASFPIVFKAYWKVLKGEKIKFRVTPKTRQSGNFLSLVRPQLVIIIVTLAGLLFNAILLLTGHRHNYAGFAINCIWSIYNLSALMVIVRAACWKLEGGER